MNKLSNCKTCATMRCCPEHCCNWDDCSCKDCEMCGGTLPLEYSKQEIANMEAEKIELERKKVEEERMRQQAIQEEAKRKQEQVELERTEALNKAAALEAAAKKKEEEKIQKKRDEEYNRTMALIEETQQKNQSTLNKINETINKLGSTLAGIQETNTAYNKFQDDFSKTMEKLVDSLGAQLTAPHKRKPGIGEEHMIPNVSTINDVVDEMANMSHFVILTGAGISAASNLPTFRGDDGYWTLKNRHEKIKATEFLTHKYFIRSPEEIWRWHYQFKTLGSKNTPNVSHFELANLQLFCKENNKKFSLITQNIDGYHVDALKKISNKDKVNSRTELDGKSPRNGINKPLSRKSSSNSDFEERKNSDPPEETAVKGFGLCEDIYEIHGNINYMRCDKECTDRLFTSPEVGCHEDFVPKCPKCKGMARPHTLFFDESYKEEYYRGESLLKEIESMDCLLVIGTQLETNLASGIVAQAIKLGSLIVEVNLQPCISYGNVRHLIGKAEEIVPILCERLQKKIADRVEL